MKDLRDLEDLTIQPLREVVCRDVMEQRGPDTKSQTENPKEKLKL